MDQRRNGNQTKMNSSQSHEDEANAVQLEGKVGEYVKELLKEKIGLNPEQSPNAMRLIDQEVKTAQLQGPKVLKDIARYVDIYREKPIKVSAKVLVPTKEHPAFNFVGKLLGPKGNSLKRLQEETMTKMAILGRGSMRDKAKEEELRQSLDPKFSHLCDDLHVEISALASPAEAHARIAYALAEIRKFLVPDNNDDIRLEQLREIQSEVPRPPLGPGGPPMRGVGRGGPVGRGAGIRGGRMMPPNMRGGLLQPPRPAPPPPMPLLNRPPGQAGKTKVLSILDRARVAMEESMADSYNSYEDPCDMGQGFYDAPIQPFNSGPPAFGGDYNGGNYYKPTGPLMGGGGGPRGGGVSRFAGARSSPYARPNK
ncbi:KH domain-containing, RNA-binding, signal transduction-associated protein 3 isoform X1 [Nilaparvata lugens]|uniref:KH domain-containing, RNA-binding, signal transduction-associated protein 3 isoform X1 n=1 Tax=Nilaparvata lugens TaxID=108931 RepID=UPI00193D9206|nr:KH domain-containing, RNA-binding, signal transduction-associated protein 3 isoform X1 [Nilaparvata lugens]XP_039296973.1 KH domain-containing, RNA-binding, signal transduction-associated protein 3 isoform X1 [Nilaparvata lugens]XP_039296974.1 KH domain-containing, RNA-binding, signal transduction-associated protein 3 isoform X1 [Nilaparvata lugens]XP_039296975.1 KH domain-containing, RNA-binding, signal transduction-associated protein 3 isoform X1 [Nilaparvata lugens]